MSRTKKQQPTTQRNGSDKKWNAMKKNHKHRKRMIGTMVRLAEWHDWGMLP